MKNFTQLFHSKTLLTLLLLFCTSIGLWAQTLQEKIAAKQQLTNIPTIYITVPDAVGQKINSVLDEKKEYHSASIKVVDNGTDGTGIKLESFEDDVLRIKVRGNETAKGSKKPYRLNFGKDVTNADGTVTSHKHDMLGLGYKKRNWVLLANQKDGTLMHNALAYTIGKTVGMEFCPGYKFVDLVINGEYLGNYMISDHCEVGKNRIDVDEDAGWYLESNREDQKEEPYVTPTGLYISIKNPEPSTEAETTALKNEVKSYFDGCVALFDRWNSDPLSEAKIAALTDPINGWRKYWDEESLVNYYIGVNVTGNHDGFMTVKMYRNPGGKIKFGPLWDFDTSYGQYDDGTTLSEDAQAQAPLMCNFIQKIVKYDPVFVKKVHDKLHEVANPLKEAMLAEINTLEERLATSQALENPNQQSGAYATSVQGLRNYTNTHFTWLVETIDTKYEAHGGDDIVIPDIPEEGDDKEVGPALNTEYTVPDMGFTGGYAVCPIPASAFNNKATSALITVSGPYYIKFIYRLNEWGYSPDALAEFPNNRNIPQTGTYLAEGEMLQRALRGELAVICNGGSDLIVTVFNNGPETPVTPPAARAQLTNLPTIYLDATTINGEWQPATLDVYDSEGKLHSSTWKAMTANVQYQGSGNKSKDSYRLKFESKTQMLDGKYKQWVLLANDDDPSMIRNAIAKELGDAVGMPWTPGYQFVDLYVNDQYMGTYQVTDRVKAEEGRSLVSGGNKDLDWQLRFNDATELAEDGTKDYITSQGVNVIYRNPDPKDLDAAGLASLKAELTNYFDHLFMETSTGEYGHFDAGVDKTQLVNWYICQEILGVYKGFSSIEAYRSVTATAADQLLHFGPLWDSEKAFGNTGLAPALDMSDLNTAKSHKGLMIEYAAYDKMKSVFNYLWKQPWFASAVKAKWAELYAGSTSSGLAKTLKTKATEISATLSESQPKNAEKWTESLGSSTYADAVSAISTYIDQRFPYLDKKFNELAINACEHNYTSYVNNGDGTHSGMCSKCGYVNTDEKTAHSYTAKSNHPYCATCGAEETSSIEGSVADGTKVYRIHEAVKTTDIKYITAESTFAPSGNKIYISNEEITGEANNLTNVVWPRTADSDYNGNEIVFSDADYTYDEKASMHVKSASYTRSMSSTWGTLCLPFKVASCDDYTLYKISDTKIADDNQSGTIVFSEIESASGLQPVVFRKNTSASSVTFRGVAQTKEGPDNGLVTVKKSKKLGNTDAMLSTGIAGSGTWVLYGNVKKSNTTAEVSPDYSNVYYIAQDKFWQGDKDVTVPTFRSVFVLTPTSGTSAAKAFSISTDDLTTGFNGKNIDKKLAVFAGNGEIVLDSSYDARVNIYNVGGSIVSSTSLSKGTPQHISLPRGIYVINGTKVTVK